MCRIEDMVNKEVNELKDELKKGGDEIVVEYSIGGEEFKHSKKVGEARMKFMEQIKTLLKCGELNPTEANKATSLFGSKTRFLYWKK